MSDNWASEFNKEMEAASQAEIARLEAMISRLQKQVGALLTVIELLGQKDAG